MDDDISAAPSFLGRRLVAPTIDEQARSRPNDVFFSIPKNEHDLSQGFVDITCKQFADAINRAAAWLQKNVGATPFEVIAYQGPNDLRYPILAVAASKIEKQVLLLSSSLAPPAVKLHLFNATSCNYFLHTSDAHKEVRRLLTYSVHVKPILTPELDTWLNNEETPVFPYTKFWHEGSDDPWLILHTTGTTGLPKTVTYTNRMMTSYDVAQTLPEPKEQTQVGWQIKRRIYAVAPMSQFSGLCAALQGPIFLHSVGVQGPKSKLPTPSVVADVLRHGSVEAFVGPPSLLREMARQPQVLELLKNIDYVQWVGAALDTDTGNTLSEVVPLCPAMGTTECGPYFLGTVDGPQDWAYYVFQSGQGIEFIEKADNLYELVFEKSKDAVWQQVFLALPKINVYETKDLFRRHPRKPGLWAYVGRSDDIVILYNSANFNATAVEEKIAAHSNVQMVLMGGNGRKHTFAIVELTSAAREHLKEKGSVAALDAIWPAVEEANSALSKCMKLKKPFVMFTDKGKELVRNTKGSLMKKESLKMFENEIDALFS